MIIYRSADIPYIHAYVGYRLFMIQDLGYQRRQCPHRYDGT